MAACKSSSNLITSVDPGERETALIDMLTNHYFIFDYLTDKEYKEVKVWVENYENGELIDQSIQFSHFEVSEEGSIIFAMLNDTNDNQLSIHIGTIADGNITSFKSQVESPDTESMISVWGTASEEMSLDDGEVVLAYLLYSDAGRGISTPSIEYFEDTNSDEFKKYDVAYLIKAEFIE